MRHTLDALDLTKLSERARWALETVLPLLGDGYELEEIAERLGVDEAEVASAHELLEAETQALAGHIVLRDLSEEEDAALGASLEEHGQKMPIYRGSDRVIVDGKHRWRHCKRLGIEPWVIDLALPADQLRALSLALNVARRHLSASERRGIVRAELLRDASRSDRTVAAAAGVDRSVVKAVRSDLEKAGLVAETATRVGADGVAQTSTKPRAEPTEKTIRLRVPLDEVDELLCGEWVRCEAFRFVESRPNVYVIQITLVEPDEITDEERQSVVDEALQLDRLMGLDDGSSLAQLLADATVVFHRPITMDDLEGSEGRWLIDRLAGLARQVEECAHA